MTYLQNLPAWSWYVAPAFLFLITVVVFFHELGHFSVARLFGVRVETFSIGFGRGIVKWKDKHGTQWKIGWIPLGGFVKFLGDADGASTPDREGVARMSAEDRAVAFPFKPLWQRALIVAAGPVANFILAIVIMTAMFMFVGQVSVPPVIGDVEAHSAAEAAGIRPGDRILAVDGTRIDSYFDAEQIISLSAGQALPLVLERGGEKLTVAVTPREKLVTDSFKNRQRIGDIGIAPPSLPIIDSVSPNTPAEAGGLKEGDRFVTIDGHETKHVEDVQKIVTASAFHTLIIVVNRGGELVRLQAKPFLNDDKKGQLGFTFKGPGVVTRLGPIAALGASLDQIWNIISTTFRALFHSPQGVHQVSGIIGISKVAGQAASIGFLYLVRLAALLSVSIGLVNLFPIPLLDGGHLLYYAFEGVLGRPLGERAQDVGFRLGLAVVLGIFLLATWNDLVRLNLF